LRLGAVKGRILIVGVQALLGFTILACSQIATVTPPSSKPAIPATLEAATRAPEKHPTAIPKLRSTLAALVPATPANSFANTPTIVPTPPTPPTPAPSPLARFGTNEVEGQAPFLVQFSNRSSDADTFHWDFGDGTTSTEKTPFHTYTEVGAFIVTLTATKGAATPANTSVSTETISVLPGPLASLVLEPAAATLNPKGTQQFLVRVADQFNNEIQGVELHWEVTGDAGTIDSHGAFAAGTISGSFDAGLRVLATGRQGTMTASADLVIRPGFLDKITLSPAELTLPVDGKQAFTIKATDRYGNEITGVKAAWHSNSGGTIDQDGLYFAGTRAGTFNTGVIASVAHEGVHKRAVAPVTVRPGPLAKITIEPALLNETSTGVTTKLTSHPFDRYGNEITGLPIIWTAEGGSIDPQGGFSAQHKSGAATVFATAESEEIARSASISILWGVDLRSALLAPAVVPAGLSFKAGECAVKQQVKFCALTYGHDGVGVPQAAKTVRTSAFFYPLGVDIPNVFSGTTGIEWLKDQLVLLEGDILDVTEVSIRPIGEQSRAFRMAVNSETRSGFTVNAVVFRTSHVLSILMTVNAEARPPFDEALRLAKHLNANVEVELASPTGPTELGAWTVLSSAPVLAAAVSPPSRVNLRPLTEGKYGWPFPLIVAAVKVQFNTTSVESTGPVFVSWAIENYPVYVQESYKVDLYVDNTIVGRWNLNATKGVYDYFTIRAWSSLLKNTTLSPGTHTLTLIVDSTNLIAETNEDDNTYSIEFLVKGVPETPIALTTAAGQLPNLIPYAPAGWDAPIVVYSKVVDVVENSLSVDVPTCTRFAVKNIGASSVREPFLVQLFLDDVLIRWSRYTDGVGPGQRITWREWCALHEGAKVTPGKHTLRLEIDFDGVIAESDETDNVYQQEFVWGTGPIVREPLLSLPLIAPLIARATTTLQALPNLTMFTPPAWAGPVVLQTGKGVFEPNLLVQGVPAYYHWAVKNDSDTDMKQGYKLELRIDGKVFARSDRPPLKAGEIDFHIDGSLPSSFMTSLNQSVSAKERLTVSLVIDPGGNVNEKNEEDNSFETVVQVLEERPPAPPPGSYSSGAISRMEDLLPITGNTITSYSQPHLSGLLEGMDSLYFAIYGKNMRDEPVFLHFLTDLQFAAYINVRCRDSARRYHDIEEDREHERCSERLRESGGFHTTWRNHNRIVIRAERTPARLIEVVAHEFGHYRQDVKNPQELSREQNTLNVQALTESQAYAHTMVMLRRFEELSRKPLLLHPKLTFNERYVTTTLQRYLSKKDSDPHERGRLFLWSVVLTDENLRDLRQELLREGRLSLRNTKLLFEYLTNITWQEADAYVAEMLAGLEQHIPTIQGIAEDRLVAGLPHGAEGSGELREAALLLP